MIRNLYSLIVKTLNSKKQGFLVICVLILATLGLVLPIHNFIAFDSDSISYSSSSIGSSIEQGFSKWGIYRFLAIAFKAILFNYFDLSNIYLPLSIIIAFLSRFIFLRVLISSFYLNSNFLVFLLISSVCNVFFIDSFTLMSRSINDLIGSLIAIIFMYFQRGLKGFKLMFLVLLSLVLGLVGYESYILFSLVVAFSVRSSERINIFISGFVGLFLIYYMNLNQFLLRHPKLNMSGLESEKVDSSISAVKFLESKYDQFLVFISDVGLAEILLAIIFSGLIYVILTYSLKPTVHKQYLSFNGSQVVSSVLMIVGSTGIIIATYFVGAIGPDGSKLQWLLISGMITICSVGIILIKPIDNIFVNLLGIIYSVLFGVSVLLVLQLAKDLTARNYCKLEAGIFRNITTVVNNMNSNMTCDDFRKYPN